MGALLELCKIICFPSLCSGTKYISTARCANKVHFHFNFYGHGELCLHSAFTTRWIKKYLLFTFEKMLRIGKFDPSVEANYTIMDLTNLSDMHYIGCLPHNRIHRKTMQRSFQVKRKIKLNKQISNHQSNKSRVFLQRQIWMVNYYLKS